MIDSKTKVLKALTIDAISENGMRRSIDVYKVQGEYRARLLICDEGDTGVIELDREQTEQLITALRQVTGNSK